MDPEKIKAALEAIKGGDADAALALLEDLVASAAGAEETAEPADEGEALNEAPAEDEDEARMGAQALSALRTLTGRQSVVEGVEELKKLRAMADKAAADKAALELDARRELIGDLVKLGAEYPSTAWEGDPKDRKPVERLSKEPIESLRARVKVFRDAKGGVSDDKRAPSAEPVEGGKVFETPDGRVTLSARELEYCSEFKADPEAYARNKAIHENAKNRRSA